MTGQSQNAETQAAEAAPHGPEPGDGDDDAGAWQPGRTWRIAVLVVLLLAGLGYLWEAWQLPAGTADQPGYGLYPRFAGLVFVVPLTGVLVSEIRRDPGVRSDAQGGSWLKPSVVLVTVLAYVVAAPTLGHIATSALVLAVVLRLMGTRRWWQVITLAAICAVVSYWLIMTVLGLPLPSGQLGFEF